MGWRGHMAVTDSQGGGHDMEVRVADDSKAGGRLLLRLNGRRRYPLTTLSKCLGGASGPS